jgi:hypothetical protein
MKPTWDDFKAFCDDENYDPKEWDSSHKNNDYIEQAYDEYMSGGGYQTQIWKKFCSQWQNVCLHCGELVSTRNPSGYCDHLQYPDYCDICSSKMTPDELRRIAREIDRHGFSDDATKMMVWAAKLEGIVKDIK